MPEGHRRMVTIRQKLTPSPTDFTDKEGLVTSSQI